MTKYERTYRYRVKIEGLGTADITAVDEYEAVEKAYSRWMYKQSDRNKYVATKLY